MLGCSQRITLIKNKKTKKTGFIASCIIGKANSDGQSYPLQFSCLSFAFRIDYPASKDFCYRGF